MPSRKTIKSLSNICIDSIATEILDVLNYDQLIFYKKRIQKLSMENLLHIFELLKKMDGINEFNLELFIRKGRNEFTLCESSRRILSLVKSELGSLKDLEISREAYLPSIEIADLLHHFPHLTYLNVSKTSADNEVLNIILRSCNNLTNLNISETNIGDHPFLKYGFEKTLPIPSPKLTYLNINQLNLNPITWITILNLFPDLEVLRSEDILPMLNVYTSQNSFPSLKLKDVYSDNEITEGNLQSLLTSCPILEKLYLCCHHGDYNNAIWYQNLTNIISRFEFLLELSLDLYNVDNKDVILDLLKLCGSKIVKLGLYSSEINIFKIACLCPQIEEFEFWGSGFEFFVSEPVIFQPFCKLTHMLICDLDETGKIETISALKNLLELCMNLKQFKLAGTGLTNNDIDAIFKNKLMSLISVHFGAVQNIDISGLEMLIMTSSPTLKEVTVEFCDQITEDDIDNLQKLVTTLNLDIIVDFKYDIFEE